MLKTYQQMKASLKDYSELFTPLNRNEWNKTEGDQEYHRKKDQAWKICHLPIFFLKIY